MELTPGKPERLMCWEFAAAGGEHPYAVGHCDCDTFKFERSRSACNCLDRKRNGNTSRSYNTHDIRLDSQTGINIAYRENGPIGIAIPQRVESVSFGRRTIAAASWATIRVSG